MTLTNRWLLPDGVAEVLPTDARNIENLRRSLLDLYHGKGYELVMPPLIEYTDSLLIGLGSDMDLHSFKMVDQLSGRLLAVRPDITPQVARIDAHSLAREGVTRYCYAGSVLHTVPMGPLSSRSPLQIGAELYGEPSVEADIELIGLMLESLALAGFGSVCLDLGHVAVYKAMLSASGLAESNEEAVFDALQRKSIGDLTAALEAANLSSVWVQRFCALVSINGAADCLARVKALFDQLPDDVAVAIQDCEKVAAAVSAKFDNVEIFFDFAELRGYHYHTGLVFAAYVDGVGQAVANGGRYNDIGAVFGRARPATGFSAAIDILAAGLVAEPEQRVYVSFEDIAQANDTVVALRAKGVAVVEGFSGSLRPVNCTHELTFQENQWVLVPV